MSMKPASAGIDRRAKSDDRIVQPVRHGRRLVILALGGIAAAAALPALFGSTAAADGEEIVVYKSPSCGCCGNWALHLRQNGFNVSLRTIKDFDAVDKKAGVPYELQSCHTAFVGGYVVEGHVPAQTIRRMLAERPRIKGLSVPGMPAGSPGMEGPEPEPYTVYSFDADGKKEIYASY